MNSSAPNLNVPASIPIAIVQPKRQRWPASWLWWITLVALIGAVLLVATALKSSGPVLTIRFTDGNGLKVGDALKYRGIVIGEVTEIVLTTDHEHVAVKVRIEPKAATIARRGSLFWIERPKVSVSRVSGLETVIGAKYLGVIPGPATESAATEFEGIESPPLLNQSQSMEIGIRFREGHGLQVGDPLRHHGITAGEITAVDLAPDLNGVAVRVRLAGEACHLAREGSQFWIERPRVSIAEVRGLDTLVGGRYLSVLPGNADAAEKTEFEGLDAAVPTEIPLGALEIVLNAPQRWGVDRGVAITYRGLKVGQVVSVGLASDGTSIEARAYVEARYRSLVRKNSVFWSSSGLDVNFGLTGFQFSAETLSSVALGGLAFATPDEPGVEVSTGQRFNYEKSPRDEWLSWHPRIAAETILPGNRSLPRPERAVVRWADRSYGIRRKHERSGWILRLNTGTLLGPADVLLPVDLSKAAANLEFAGQGFDLTVDRVERIGTLAIFRPLELNESPFEPWPKSLMRVARAPEDCHAITDSSNEPIPIAASSLQARDNVWNIRETCGITPDHHGAVVVSAKDGQLIGQLLINRGKASIALIERVVE